MAGMSDFAFSAKMRDIVTRMVEETVDRIRPVDRYGEVDSINPAINKCGVILNGETAPILISMGSVKPVSVGSIVRVSGRTGDRYISDVIGSPVDVPFYTVPVGGIMPFAGTVAPAKWLICNGSVVLRATYPELFAVLSTNYNWGGETVLDFRIPYLIDGYAPVGVGAGVNPLGQYGGSATAALSWNHVPQHVHTGVDHLHNDFSMQKTILANPNNSAAHQAALGVSSNAGSSVLQGSDSGRFMTGVSGNTGAADRSLTTGAGNQPTSPFSGLAATGNAFSVRNPYLSMNFIIRATP